MTNNINPIYILGGQSNSNPWFIRDAFEKKLSSYDDNYDFVKFSKNGSALFENNYWQGDWSVDSESELLDTLLGRIDERIAEITIENKIPVVAGFLWIQGEADSRSAENAGSYEENLLNLIAEFRENYGENFPFYIAELRTTSESFAYHEVVREAQHNIANAFDNVEIVDLSHLPVSKDGVHYTRDSYIEMGRIYAELVKDAQLKLVHDDFDPEPVGFLHGILKGNNSDNLLVGSNDDDIMVGKKGDDTLYGFDGKDKLYGRAGDDTIYGGAGIDIIAGESGSDVLEGGEGADKFVFKSTDGDLDIDTILDFEVGTDDIFLRDITVESLIDSDAGAVLIFDTGSTLILNDVTVDDLSIGDFVLRGTSDSIM